MWIGKKPRTNHLLIIGSKKIFTHTAKITRDKKAHRGFLVGCDGDERYRIYTPEIRTIQVKLEERIQSQPSFYRDSIWRFRRSYLYVTTRRA